jgi:tetratricopeptide (TPR) repeat protein
LPIPTAEESYLKGLGALHAGRRREALALFEAAIEIERRRSPARPQSRYVSHFGLCLAVERNEVEEALRYCREAVTLEGQNPDLRCNLGQVLLHAGRRREAYRCFLQALSLKPGHAMSTRALKMMGIRRRPILPFLPRNSAINVLLGRLI